MKIASWNINSLRKRQERLLDWLAKEEPDVVCLQETKCSDDQFSELALSAAGYRCIFHGQKSYNGVVILSRDELCERQAALCDESEDPQARVVAANMNNLGVFCWCDYPMLALQKNRGLLIDPILASKSLAERCAAAGIDREMRKGKDPSDHAPVWAEFS